MLADAMNKMPVQLILDNRKVYLGLVLSLGDPRKERKWVSFLPLLSGYQDKDTLQVYFTIDYRKILSAVQVGAEDLDYLNIKDFVTTVSFGSIVSVRKFDEHAYRIIEPCMEDSAPRVDSDPQWMSASS